MEWTWIPIGLVVAAAGFYLISCLWGRGDPTPADAVTAAKKQAQDIRDAADMWLQAELQETDADREVLDQIKQIDDPRSRLDALADYVNRRGATP